MVDSPFRHKSACELPTDYLQIPASVSDYLVANLWRLIQDVATAHCAVLGIVPNEVIAMMSKVLLISGREGDIQSVKKQAFDTGKHGLIVKLEPKYCVKPSQGFSGVHLFGARRGAQHHRSWSIEHTEGAGVEAQLFFEE